jgi:ribulose-phosphate 3-epimerase
MNDYKIAASLLSADFAQLGKEAADVMAAGADMLHLDVMDNHYVPNLTVGPLVCEALRRYGIQAPIDVHLMVKPVDHLITAFAKAGATHISFHPEASEHVDRSLSLIQKQGCLAGLAFNPATPLHWLDYVMDKIDIILVMSVNPGFGGQHFIPSALEKIRHIKERIQQSHRSIHLAVDGGIKTDNIAEVAKAGANMFIAGSAIFHHPPYATTLSQMRKALEDVPHAKT